MSLVPSKCYVVVGANKSDHHEGPWQKLHPCRFRGGWAMGSRETTSTVTLSESWWHPGYLLCFAELLKGDVKLVMKVNRRFSLLLWEKGEKKTPYWFQKEFFHLLDTTFFFSTSGWEEEQGGKNRGPGYKFIKL